jgi:hypothetical protein
VIRRRGGTGDLKGKRMSCENEPYRHERQARNCSERATEAVNGADQQSLM